jgi:spoIIIJ-associated protein
MTGLFGRIFGGRKTESAVASGPEGVIDSTLSELLQLAGLQLQFKIEAKAESEFEIDVYGDDESLLLAKEGQLLDGIQLFLTRVCQHRFPDLRLNITVDNSGYREEVNRELIDLAEKLKNIAVEKGKPVYFRALPPRDRKLVHQYLADDGRVRSRSVGEGLFKKIKIFPTNQEQTSPEMTADA